jgi:hypothetical protein
MKLGKIGATALALSFLVACGGTLKYTQDTSPRAPGAKTEIKADVMKAEVQTRLNMTISFLPPPKTIKPSANAFVAWQRKGGDAPWQRVGALKYDESDRVGLLKDVTVPDTSFILQVTAEDKPDVALPSEDVIVTQNVNK